MSLSNIVVNDKYGSLATGFILCPYLSPSV